MKQSCCAYDATDLTPFGMYIQVRGFCPCRILEFGANIAKSTSGDYEVDLYPGLHASTTFLAKYLVSTYLPSTHVALRVARHITELRRACLTVIAPSDPRVMYMPT